jgi:hypothetical protein
VGSPVGPGVGLKVGAFGSGVGRVLGLGVGEEG